jgi:hypothetical protein
MSRKAVIKTCPSRLSPGSLETNPPLPGSSMPNTPLIGERFSATAKLKNPGMGFSP